MKNYGKHREDFYELKKVMDENKNENQIVEKTKRAQIIAYGAIISLIEQTMTDTARSPKDKFKEIMSITGATKEELISIGFSKEELEDNVTIEDRDNEFFERNNKER